MTFLDNAGRKGKSTDQNLFDYYADLHPKTESQFRDQKFLGGISSYYRDWMHSRSLDEYNRGVRDMYNVGFGDIKYPWLSEITSQNGTQSLGRATWSFSRNIGSLYKSAIRKRSKTRSKRKGRRSRRY